MIISIIILLTTTYDYESRLSIKLHPFSFIILKIDAACIISNTDMSLYLVAKTSLLFIRNLLVRAGWPTSWPKLAMIAPKVSIGITFYIRSDLLKIYIKEAPTSAA